MRTKPPTYLSQDELKRLLAVIKSRRDRALFLVAYRHGLRASEIGLLQAGDVDLAHARITITRLKGSLGGVHLLYQDELKVLKAWLKDLEPISPRAPLFPSQRGSPISRRQLDNLIKGYGEMAGIPQHKRHFHVLKHSIGTHLREANADAFFIQDWLGHRDIRNTLIYARVSPAVLDTEARRLFASPMIVGA